MPLYVLDTDTYSLLLDGHPETCRRVVEKPQESLALTIVTVEESLSGWYTQIRRARKEAAVVRAYAALQRLVENLRGARILPFDDAASSIAQQLRERDRRIGTNDLRIAAVVLSCSGILVTRNSDDFSRFPGLTTEDWSAAVA